MSLNKLNHYSGLIMIVFLVVQIIGGIILNEVIAKQSDIAPIKETLKAVEQKMVDHVVDAGKHPNPSLFVMKDADDREREHTDRQFQILLTEIRELRQEIRESKQLDSRP